LELILEVGLDNIAGELARKRAWLVPALQAKGYTVLNPAPKPECAGGITSIFRPDTDLLPIHQRLAEAGIIVSLRSDRQGQKYLRFSPHFYNTDAELHRVVELL